MKRRWLITLLLCVAVLGGALAFRLWPRTLSPDQCGTVYRHYAAVEGVEATYIKDKHIGGDEQVDVTLLQATDSTSWATLLRDLGKKLRDDDRLLPALIPSGDGLLVAVRR